MAKIKMRGKEIFVKDGEPIKKYCEELGISTFCEDGVCGTCLIKIKSGKENLSELTKAEKEIGLKDKTQRLACQCKIKKGEVEIDFW